ncbi:hypothetical protein GCM10009738_11130 [Kitasatospora viridis]
MVSGATSTGLPVAFAFAEAVASAVALAEAGCDELCCAGACFAGALVVVVVVVAAVGDGAGDGVADGEACGAVAAAEATGTCTASAAITDVAATTALSSHVRGDGRRSGPALLVCLMATTPEAGGTEHFGACARGRTPPRESTPPPPAPRPGGRTLYPASRAPQENTRRP